MIACESVRCSSSSIAGAATLSAHPSNAADHIRPRIHADARCASPRRRRRSSAAPAHAMKPAATGPPCSRCSSCRTMAWLLAAASAHVFNASANARIRNRSRSARQRSCHGRNQKRQARSASVPVGGPSARALAAHARARRGSSPHNIRAACLRVRVCDSGSACTDSMQDLQGPTGSGQLDLMA